MPRNFPPQESPPALRSRAERLAAQRHAAGTMPPRALTDAQRLLHELEVHQIELEMQNEELSRANHQAEAIAEKFSALYDFAPIGYVTLDERGGIENLNHTAAKLLGKTRSELTGTLLVQGVARHDRDGFLQYLKASSEAEGKVIAEVDLGAADGGTVPVQLSTVCVQTPMVPARQYRMVITDISALRQAEKSRKLVIDILEHLNAGGELRPLCREILGKIRAFVGVEAAAIRLRQGDDYPYFEHLGFPAKFIQAKNSLCGRSLSGHLARDEQGRPIPECLSRTVIGQRTDVTKPFFTGGGSFWTNSATALLATTTAADRQPDTRNCCYAEGYESMMLVPLRSGEEMIGLLQLADRRPDRFAPELVRFLEGVGASIGVALRRKQTEQELRRFNTELEERIQRRTATIRSLATDLTMAEQQEKQRLAHILHDHLQQAVMGARYILAGVRPHCDAQGIETLALVEAILTESVEAMRTLAVELSPPVLQQQGLAAALRWLGKWMREKHGLPVKVTAKPGVPPLSVEVSVLLYQAARELLFNVVKHAGVKSASVSMGSADSMLTLVVSDKGKGFDPAQLQTTAPDSFGLFWVRERLALLGGQLDVASAPGQGSRFTLRAPLSQCAARPVAAPTDASRRKS